MGTIGKTQQGGGLNKPAEARMDGPWGKWISLHPGCRGIREVWRGFCPDTPPAALPICPCREGVEKVLGSLTLSSEELAYGKTKIFIRSPKTVSQSVLHLVGVD